MTHGKKIAIVHYRAGRTDGVSLEIEKRSSILRDLGHEVRIVSGPVSTGSDFVIDDLEFDIPEVVEVKENSFACFGRNSWASDTVMDHIESIATRIERAFLAYHETERFDAVLVHNIFSHGRHIAAASAFERIFRRMSVPVIATHHDYYWERSEYQQVTSERLQVYLQKFVPPSMANLIHVSINSIARDELERRRGISSIVLPDVWDFTRAAWDRDDYNADYLEHIDATDEDLIILQATRIVARKGIEIAVDFAKTMGGQLEQLIGKRLYNGKILTENSRVILVLAGYAELSAGSYLDALRLEAQRAGIEIRFVSDIIGASRHAGETKTYSLWDAYVYSDLVSYPSLVEGWGNQFIEAIFARRPIVVFEYPVFQADIRHEGYHYISLGDSVEPRGRGKLVQLPVHALEEAVSEACNVLLSEDTNQKLEENARIGERFHGFHVMRDFLERELNRASS